VDLVHEHHRRKPAPTIAELPRIEGRTEPHAPVAPPMPSLALEAEHGKSKLRAFALSRFSIGALVLIVLIIVAGKVLIARSGGTSRENPHREDRGRYIERIQRTEVIERTCERDGS